MTKRRSHNAVSLFPFLAVLVCTMGALILLLLVTTRRIRQKQEEVAAVSVEPKPAMAALAGVSATQMAEAQSQLESATIHRKEAQQELLDAEQRHKTLMKERQSLKDDLDALQAAMQVREDGDKSNAADLLQQKQDLLGREAEHDAIEDKLAKALDAVRSAESQLADAEGLALAAEQLVAQNLSAIEMLRRQRRLNQERVADVGTKETLIEFTGARGTARTPIVVDVDSNGFLFPTSGVRVRRRDLAGFAVSDNPLLAAVLATHRHRSNDSMVSRPYVLLLVRPGGILDFYPAQRVLNDAHIHFGYELMAEDEKVAVAEPVEGETEAVRVAVLNALSRRNQHLAGASGIRERIAALRAKEAMARRREAGRSRRQQQPPQGELADESENPFVRPFPRDEAAVSPDHRGQAVAANEWPSSADRWGDHQSQTPSRSTILQERRSIQQLLNPGMDIERSLAEAVAARNTAQGAGRGGSTPNDDERRFPGGNRGGSSSGSQVAQQPAGSANSDSRVDQNESAEEQFWRAVEGREHSPEQQLAGSPASSAGTPNVSPQNNLPPLEGQPYQAGDAAQQSASSANGRSVGGQPGSADGTPSSQPSELELTYYEPVTVYLDPQYLTVAGDDPVPLHGATVSAILKALLHDLDKATRKGPELSFVRCLPVVKFVVSPGAHTLYLQVAAELHDRGIPASSVVSMESHVEEHSNEIGAALRSLDPDAERRLSASRMKPVSDYRELQ